MVAGRKDRSRSRTTRTSPNRPTVQLGDGYGDRPLVIVAVANVASGKVTRLTNVGMATDLNTPQWLDNGHLLIMRVPAKG